jgi:hypothetical protein
VNEQVSQINKSVSIRNKPLNSMIESGGNSNIYTVKYQNDKSKESNYRQYSKSQYGRFREVSPLEKKI